MKRLLLILILTLSFQAWTMADDIRDFQIEGMSIGDSALEYFTKKEIRTERKYRIKYPNSNKFSAITFYKHPILKVYESVQINVKNKDKKYIIYSISGINYYTNNIGKCKKQMELISAELIKIFPNSSNTKRTKKHEYDKSGKSLIHQNIFDMDSGDEVRVECYDWSKKMFNKNDLEDQLVVTILSEEFSYFMANVAYN
jgi:hypothetical protein